MPHAPVPRPRRVALVVLAVWLVFAATFGVHSWNTSHRDQVAQLRTVAELAEAATDRYFQQLQTALTVLAEQVVDDTQSGHLVAVQRALARFGERHRELHAVSLLDPSGKFLATSTTTKLTGLPSVADQRDFAATVAALKRDTAMEITRPLFGPASGRWVLPIRYTLRAPSDEILGFIVASAPVEMLQSFWSQAPAVAKATITLLRDDGYLVNRYPLPPGTDPAALYGKPLRGAIYQSLRSAGFPPQGYIEGMSGLAGRNLGIVYARLEHYPLTLLASLPQDEFYAAWWDRTWVAFVLSGLLAAGTVLAIRRYYQAQWRWSQDRMRIDRELRASQDFLERAGEVAGVGGWSLDLQSNELVWSTHTRRIHEVPANYAPSVDTAIEFYAPEARPRIMAAFQLGLQEGQPWDLELPLITAKGRRIWVRAQGRAERQDGRVVRLVGAFQDVTEYRQRRIALQEETALREQAERHAEQLDRLLGERSQMLDVMAHEVRQPLNNASAALQAAQAALRGDTADSAAIGLARAQLVLDDVQASIDNTLAVSELVASPRSLRREDTDIEFVVRLALQDVPAEHAERVAVRRDTATRTAEMDAGLIRLALRNLVLNALRYSPPSSAVSLRILDQDEPLAVVFEIADHGAGFEDELLPHVFERGRRGRQGASVRGHGLGLYIVKRVAELHGGTVEAANRTEGGAIVRLVIAQGLAQ